MLTLDQFAAEYAGQNNFGPYSIILPQFSRSGAIRPDEWEALGYQHAEYLLGLILLHNSQLWFPAYIPIEPTSRLYLALDENGLDATYTFVGYWKQQALALPDHVKASFFVSADRKKAFMIVMNLEAQDQRLDLRLNLQSLGMGGPKRAEVLYPGGQARLVGGVIRDMVIPAKDFRLYVIE